MSTRAQVIVAAGGRELWFYRHSDGYPAGVKASLDKFCMWMRECRIRRDLGQAAGWLVLIGAAEYRDGKTAEQVLEPFDRNVYGMGWKVGSYEPCPPGLHGDVKHVYLVDVDKAEWKDVTRRYVSKR